MKKNLHITVGEIYLINFSGKHRPAVIINDTGDSCMVAPLTTLQLNRSDNHYEISKRWNK